ncbi:MAG: ribosomal protein S18-alanine N-acetyltransferase [Clostridia bacterium]
MEKINIRAMTIDDLNNIKDILLSDFDEFWTYDIFKDELNSNNSKYIVAETSNNTIVGFAGIKTILDEAELMNIVTKKNMRGKGIATFMLDSIISVCKNEHIKLLNLEVNNQNTIAINLYKKYNFKEVGLRKKYYDNTYDAVLMTLKI